METVSAVTNAIGFEMFKHDRDSYIGPSGVETIWVTAEETERARAAAVRVVRELEL